MPSDFSKIWKLRPRDQDPYCKMKGHQKFLKWLIVKVLFESSIDWIKYSDIIVAAA